MEKKPDKMKKLLDGESHILKNGGKRLRHGSYKTVYLCSRGGGRRCWRAEYQRKDTRGVVRLRKWFSDKDQAWAWLKGR